MRSPARSELRFGRLGFGVGSGVGLLSIPSLRGKARSGKQARRRWRGVGAVRSAADAAGPGYGSERLGQVGAGAMTTTVGGGRR
jgi:hypothetical protein